MFSDLNINSVFFLFVFVFSESVFSGKENRSKNKQMGPQFSSAQSLSHVQLSVTPGTAPHQASLSITNFFVHQQMGPN